MTALRPPAFLLVVVALSSFAASPARAQETPRPSSGSERARAGCFRPHALPTCSTYWIVELQGSLPWVQTERRRVDTRGASFRSDAFRSSVEWNVGHAFNLSPAWALGAAITAGSGSSDPLTGIKLRARRWWGPDARLDLEAGIIRSDVGGNFASPVTGVGGGVRLNFRDRGSLQLRWDAISVPPVEYPPGSVLLDEPGGRFQALSVGAGLASDAALLGSAVLGLGLLVLIIGLDDTS